MTAAESNTPTAHISSHSKSHQSRTKNLIRGEELHAKEAVNRDHLQLAAASSSAAY